MKTKQLILTALCFLSLNAASQIPNGGFENWAPGPGGYSDPVGWTTSSNAGGAVHIETAAGHTGNYSARINYIVATPFWYSGWMEYNSGPISAKPLSISGWWKDQFASFGESIGVDIYVYDNNGSLMGSKSTYSNSFNGTSAWTSFNAQIMYTMPNNPVGYYKIHITTGVANTSYYGFVDDLNVTFATDINEKSDIVNGSYISSEGGIPTLHMNLSRDLYTNIKILDISGRVVFSNDVELNSGLQNYLLGSQSLKSGMYICCINSKELNLTQKFQIIE